MDICIFSNTCSQTKKYIKNLLNIPSNNTQMIKLEQQSSTTLPVVFGETICYIRKVLLILP